MPVLAVPDMAIIPTSTQHNYDDGSLTNNGFVENFDTFVDNGGNCSKDNSSPSKERNGDTPWAASSCDSFLDFGEITDQQMDKYERRKSNLNEYRESQKKFKHDDRLLDKECRILDQNLKMLQGKEQREIELHAKQVELYNKRIELLETQIQLQKKQLNKSNS